MQKKSEITSDFAMDNKPYTYDECGLSFSKKHALTYKNGGLVDLHHNEIADEWAQYSQVKRQKQWSTKQTNYDTNLTQTHPRKTETNQTKAMQEQKETKESFAV